MCLLETAVVPPYPEIKHLQPVATTVEDCRYQATAARSRVRFEGLESAQEPNRGVITGSSASGSRETFMSSNLADVCRCSGGFVESRRSSTGSF